MTIQPLHSVLPPNAASIGEFLSHHGYPNASNEVLVWVAQANKTEDLRGFHPGQKIVLPAPGQAQAIAREVSANADRYETGFKALKNEFILENDRYFKTHAAVALAQGAVSVGVGLGRSFSNDVNAPNPLSAGVRLGLAPSFSNDVNAPNPLSAGVRLGLAPSFSNDVNAPNPLKAGVQVAAALSGGGDFTAAPVATSPQAGLRLSFEETHDAKLESDATPALPPAPAVAIGVDILDRAQRKLSWNLLQALDSAQVDNLAFTAMLSRAVPASALSSDEQAALLALKNLRLQQTH